MRVLFTEIFKNFLDGKRIIAGVGEIKTGGGQSRFAV
jgi:hypothetical protein